jgi:hypothetical protein
MIDELVLSLIVFNASAGAVVLLHASPIPLANFKPLNCAFCQIVWAAFAAWAFLGWVAPTNIGLHCLLGFAYPLYAGLLIGYTPWLFRSFESKTKALDLQTTLTQPRTDFKPSDELPTTPEP